MKCHNILGVKECASAVEIERAYNQKMRALSMQKGNFEEKAYERKCAEIRKAGDDCNRWLSAGPTDQLKMRAKDLIKPPYKSKRMYSTIDCCTCCNDNCGDGNKSFCDSICCSECQSVPRFFDILFWIVLGVIGGFFLLRAIFRGIARAIRTGKQTAYDNAVQKLPSLRADASRLSAQLQNFSETRKLQQERERELSAFLSFFESIGAIPADSLRAAEHDRVEKQVASEQSVRSVYNRIIQEIDNAERIVRRGRPR